MAAPLTPSPCDLYCIIFLDFDHSSHLIWVKSCSMRSSSGSPISLHVLPLEHVHGKILTQNLFKVQLDAIVCNAQCFVYPFSCFRMVGGFLPLASVNDAVFNPELFGLLFTMLSSWYEYIYLTLIKIWNPVKSLPPTNSQSPPFLSALIILLCFFYIHPDIAWLHLLLDMYSIALTLVFICFQSF